MKKRQVETESDCNISLLYIDCCKGGFKNVAKEKVNYTVEIKLSHIWKAHLLNILASLKGFCYSSYPSFTW